MLLAITITNALMKVDGALKHAVLHAAYWSTSFSACPRSSLWTRQRSQRTSGQVADKARDSYALAMARDGQTS